MSSLWKFSFTVRYYCYVFFFLFCWTHTGKAEVSLYLPIHQNSQLENRIEQLFVLTHQPIIKRPIPLHAVRKALDILGDRAPELRRAIEADLRRYRKNAALTHAAVRVSSPTGGPVPLAHSRGRQTDSHYSGAVQAHWRVDDWALFNLGGLAYQSDSLDKHNFLENTFLSLGWRFFQIDLGYRPHWLGPFQESAMLVSTQAPSVPGVTFSNVNALGAIGFRYEVFWGRLSESDKIRVGTTNERQSGYPELFAIHLSLEPLKGFAIGVNRLLQYGGGNRDNSITSAIDAFIQPNKFDNLGELGEDFGNQLSSISTRYTFGDGFPLSIYMEYAGEDTTATSKVALGNTSLMFGVHMPKITNELSFTYEVGSWQNAWYTNGNYGDGLTNHSHILGHWGGSRREFGDAVGATAHTAKLVWDPYEKHSLIMKMRTLDNENYRRRKYDLGRELLLEYTYDTTHSIVGIELNFGTDVFGENYSLLSGFLRW